MVLQQGSRFLHPGSTLSKTGIFFLVKGAVLHKTTAFGDLYFILIKRAIDHLLQNRSYLYYAVRRQNFQPQQANCHLLAVGIEYRP